MLFSRLLQRLLNPRDADAAPAASSAPPPVSDWAKKTYVGTKSVPCSFQDMISRIRDGHLSIPEEVTQIPDSLFDGHGYTRENGELVSKSTIVSRIRSVSLPGTVKRIGSRAFADCENLEQVHLSEGLEQLENNAFTGCLSLKEIRLPRSLRTVTGWAFYRSGLEKPVFSWDGKTLIYYPQTWTDPSYAVPEGVTEIGSRSFLYMDQLKTLILPQSLKRICTMAFIDCGFQELSLPEGTVLEDHAISSKHPVKVRGQSARDLLDEKITDYRANGISFLKPQSMALPGEVYWETDAFLHLSRRCAQGELAAMEQMGDFFLERAQSGSPFYTCAAQFWRTRAWQYGSETARAYILDWVHAHPNSRMTSPWLSEQLGGSASGTQLKALGFPGFPPDRTYHLDGLDAQGVVGARAWESSEGPDEDGFGREELYDWWYLDEFLTFSADTPCIHSCPGRAKHTSPELFRALHDQAAAAEKFAESKGVPIRFRGFSIN